MSTFNFSSIAKSQQWRNDLLMKPSDLVPKPTKEVFNEPPQLKYPGHTGHPGQQGHQGHSGHTSHPAPPVHLVQPDRPSYSGHGHAYQPGHASHAGQAGQPGRQMLTNASVCCEQPNCNRAKIEQMPEHYYPEPDYVYVSATPFAMMNPGQGRDPQSGKKEPSAPPSDHNYMYCPCRRGQLVTICCTGRNCDNATKIDEGIHMGPPGVYMGPPMCPPDVQMGSPDAHKGPSDKKRARTSYNQYKY